MAGMLELTIQEGLSVGRLIADCTAFAAGKGRAPGQRTLVAAIAGAKRPQDGERLAGVALCASAVTEPVDVIALIGAVRDDYARCNLFSDAIRMQLIGVDHAVAAAAVMDEGGCWRRNVLLAFLRLPGAAEVLTWADVHGALPEIGTKAELNFVVVSGVEHGILLDWSVAWPLAACADAMGQRDVARAAIATRIAPEWSVLHADLERMTTRSETAGAPHDHPSLHPQPEEQRALVVQMAIGAGLLSDAADVAAEVRRALALTTPYRGWHELSMLRHAADRAGIAIPDQLRGDVDAAQRANNARNAERARETQQATAHRPRRRTTTTRRPVSDPAVPSITPVVQGQLALPF